jgi:hypothetical protein
VSRIVFVWPFTVSVTKELFHQRKNCRLIFKQDVVFGWLDVGIITSFRAADMDAEERVGDRGGGAVTRGNETEVRLIYFDNGLSKSSSGRY